MKYQFVRKDEIVQPGGEPAALRAARLFRTYLKFDDECCKAGLPKTPEFDPTEGGKRIEVTVGDSLTHGKIVPILDKLGYRPLENIP